MHEIIFYSIRNNNSAADVSQAHRRLILSICHEESVYQSSLAIFLRIAVASSTQNRASRTASATSMEQSILISPATVQDIGVFS